MTRSAIRSATSVLGTLLLLAETMAQSNPLVNAVCGKSKDELKAIIKQASDRGKAIDVDENANHELLAKALYDNAMTEVPQGSAQPWPGCDGVTPSTPKTSTPGSKSSTLGASSKMPPWEQMVEQMLRTMDKDKDGRLAREELQKMIDQTNAQAKAKGLADNVDFFTAVDLDGSGYAERDELIDYFKRQIDAPKADASKATAAPDTRKTKPTSKSQDPKDLMFKALDKNRDGKLDREEMRTVIEKTNQQAANQQAGESGEDFFNTLDRDGDDTIDEKEAEAFFAAATGMVGKGKEEL